MAEREMTGETAGKPMLPPIPEPHPTLSVTIDLVLDHDFETYSNGSMRMTLDRSDVSANGEVVGHVASVLPNGVVVKVGSRSYYLSPIDLWNAVEEAESRTANEERTR
jgi:archaellum component FlaF (FlaF/FlaG flagellin family)